MPPPRTNSNSTLRRPQEKQGKEVACLNEQMANGKEQRALSSKHLTARQGNLPRQSRDRIRNCIYIWTSRLSHAGAECAKFSYQRAAFIHTLYMHRDCSDAKEPEDDEIILDERLTKGTPPGEHVPIGSRIWLVSRVFATFALAFMRTCSSLMHIHMATRTIMWMKSIWFWFKLVNCVHFKMILLEFSLLASSYTQIACQNL